jgi:hypothetical protein
MTTFTSDDREEEYKKIVEAAPYQPGYEDAVPMASPPHIVDSGASVMVTSNEPVAWIDPKELDMAVSTSVTKHKQFDTDIPLYTHPVKTLSNEEILCLWDWWSGEILSTDILDFADTYKRALLGEEGLVEWHQEYVKRMNNETT